MDAVEDLIDADEEQIVAAPLEHGQIVALGYHDEVGLAALGTEPFEEIVLTGHR